MCTVVFSLLVVLVLSVGKNLVELHKNEFSRHRYDKAQDRKGDLHCDEPNAWMALYGDVMRPPRLRKLLCIVVAAGCQLFIASTVECVNDISGPNLDIESCVPMLLIQSVLTFGCGCTFAPLLKSMGMGRWQPACSGAMIAIGEERARALPILALCAGICLGLGRDALEAGGFFSGFHAVPRPVPLSTTCASRPVALPLAALLLGSWGSCCLAAVEDPAEVLHSPRASGAVAALLSSLGIELSLLTTYSLLLAEDHRWWWPSFAVGCATVLSFHAPLLCAACWQPGQPALHECLLEVGSACRLMLIVGSLGSLTSLRLVLFMYGKLTIDFGGQG
mmetsp:Transcript_18615/g.43751  ORF Transcript_18615/g.43751 Transcript_18615/m.43751 type:complete len:334 (-) Transcript_18615:399-1400(-)